MALVEDLGRAIPALLSVNAMHTVATVGTDDQAAKQVFPDIASLVSHFAIGQGGLNGVEDVRRHDCLVGVFDDDQALVVQTAEFAFGAFANHERSGIRMIPRHTQNAVVSERLPRCRRQSAIVKSANDVVNRMAVVYRMEHPLNTVDGFRFIARNKHGRPRRGFAKLLSETDTTDHVALVVVEFAIVIVDGPTNPLPLAHSQSLATHHP